MATRIETLIEQVKTNLGNDADIDAAKVSSNRVMAMNDGDLPAYNVVLGADSPTNELGPANVAFIDWEQVLYIDLYERSILGNIDAVFLDMRANVHRSLMADVTQTLDFVLTTVPGGADEPIIDDEGERKNMVYRTVWGFMLRTSIDDLETT